MTATENESVHASNSGWEPISVNDNFTVMSVAFLLSNADDALIWRGPKKNALIKQFLKDVDWCGDDIDSAPEFLMFVIDNILTQDSTRLLGHRTSTCLWCSL